MDFSLSEEQQLLKRTVRNFAEAEIAPHARAWDEQQEFPRELWAKLGELGLTGVVWPAEYGGSELSTFDYAIVCGFMDYVAEPMPVIDKVLSITKSKAFFSFPAAAGALAWQRRMRYKSRCDLFMYTESQLRDLFRGKDADVTIEPITRDYFVTAAM